MHRLAFTLACFIFFPYEKTTLPRNQNLGAKKKRPLHSNSWVMLFFRKEENETS
jgi:hypothetical protein